MGNPCKILIVGGCHLNGFPVGEEHAFTHVALKYLADSEAGSVNVLPLSNLRSGPQIVAACRELKPDAVVLQLGHYETPLPLRKSLGCKAKKRGLIDGVPVRWRPRPGMRYKLTPTMLFRKLKRLSVAALIVATGKRKKMFDSRMISSSLDSILADLKQLQLRAIVVLGPFSVPDPLTRYFRRAVVPIFEQAARKHGCTFVDIFSFLESFPKGDAFRESFADQEHLSVQGHQRVGREVGKALRLALENATVAEGVAAARIKRESRTSKPSRDRQTLVAPYSPSVGAA